jgi:hypothetical protein
MNTLDAIEAAITLLPEIRRIIRKMHQLLAQRKFDSIQELVRPGGVDLEEVEFQISNYADNFQFGEIPESVLKRFYIVPFHEKHFDVVDGVLCESDPAAPSCSMFIKPDVQDNYWIIAESHMYDANQEETDLVLFLEVPVTAQAPLLIHQVYLYVP